MIRANAAGFILSFFFGGSLTVREGVICKLAIDCSQTIGLPLFGEKLC